MLSREKDRQQVLSWKKRQTVCTITTKRQITYAIAEKKKTHGMFYSWKKDSQHVLSRRKRQIACVIMAKILFLVPFSFKIVRRFPMAHVSHCKCKIEGIKRSTLRCCCIFKVITLKKQQSIMYMIMSCISEFSFTKCY